MNLTERREQFRSILAGNECTYPASAGYKTAILSGSLASAAILGSPDQAGLTLTEIAQETRRITKAGNLSLMVDGDHGFGNAVNVMRTVEEYEQAGAAGLTIEDTVLPRPYGASGDVLISLEEMEGKLRAALAARQDKSLVIIGRTSAFGNVSTEEGAKRVKAFEKVGVDAILLMHFNSREQLSAAHEATSLPITLIGGAPDVTETSFLTSVGVRAHYRADAPFWVAVKAMEQAYKDMYAGVPPAEVATRMASPELRSLVLRSDQHAQRMKDFAS
jgi:carboxyvinyl-carboxyphosphonate phosphorylmutase